MSPFRLIRRIKRLAYELKLLNHWKIHLVFTIIMLKPGLAIKNDPYNRPRPDYLDFVFVNGDTEFLKLFKISKIIDKRVTYKGRIRKRIIEYFVRQIGYGSEKDRWYDQAYLDKTKVLIKEYKRDLLIDRTLLTLLSNIIIPNILSPTVPKNTRKERSLFRKRRRLKKVQLLLVKELRNSELKEEL